MRRSEPQMAGVVLAGAHAWGGTPLERLLPRPLLPVADSPLIGYSLRALRDSGVREITICANSDTRSVLRTLGDGAAFDLQLAYFEDHDPRGPGGCIRDAVQWTDAEHVIVTEASVMPMFDFGPMVAAHRRTNAAVTVAVLPGAPPRPAGVYVFSRRAIEHIRPTGYQDIKERLLPRLAAAGELVQLCEFERVVPRVTDFPSYLRANEWVLEQLAAGALELPGYRRQGSAFVHALADVRGAEVIGTALIGPYTMLGDGAVVVGPTVCGAGCEIGAGALVSESVVWDRVGIGARAEVNGAVVASGALIVEGARVTDAIVSATVVAPPPSPTRRVMRPATASVAPTHRAHVQGNRACPV